MNLLLDTHVWIWSFLDPDRLSPPSRMALQQGENVLWLSPLASWEAAMLAKRGRLRLFPDATTWLRRALQQVPMQTAELTHEVAALSVQLKDFRVTDPVDRFLAASCLTYDLTLVTADRRLRSYPLIRTLW